MNEKAPATVPDLPDVDALVHFIGSIFADINLGLIVYHLEDPAEATSLRMVYVNHEASRYTGADLSGLVGKTILDAFPNLAETELPETYARVATEKKPEKLGTIAYGDEHLEQSYYAVKAFPLPNGCMGVLFENITLRKQLSEKVQHRTEQLSDQYKSLQKHVAEVSEKLGETLGLIQQTTDALATEADLSAEKRARLNTLAALARDARSLSSTLSDEGDSPSS